MDDAPRYSIIIPAYNEEAGIAELVSRVCEAMGCCGERFEVLVIDDGSTDGTWGAIVAAAGKHGEVAGHRLNRNFGQQAAIYAGLDLSRGEAVGVMDGDGQDPPEVLVQLFERWREGYDVVYAVRTKRKEGLVKRLCYLAFYRVFSALAAMPIPVDSGDFSVVDRDVAKFITATNDRTPFFRGLRSWYGGKQVGVSYERPARLTGKTKHSWFNLSNTALAAITSYSKVPLRLAVYTGGCISLLSFCYVAFIVVRRLLVDAPPELHNASRGWSSLATLVGFLGGLNLLVLGLVGEYIAHVFDASKKFPVYLTRESTRGDKGTDRQ